MSQTAVIWIMVVLLAIPWACDLVFDRALNVKKVFRYYLVKSTDDTVGSGVQAFTLLTMAVGAIYLARFLKIPDYVGAGAIALTVWSRKQ